MDVKTLLALAGEIKSEQDLDECFGKFKSAFELKFRKRLAHLHLCNDERLLEPLSAFMRFEAIYEISDEHVIVASIEIRFSEFSVWISTSRMHDKHGMHSKTWTPTEEEVLRFKPENSISDITRAMVDGMIGQHCLLLESAGLNKEEASHAAKRAWNRRAKSYKNTPEKEIVK